MGALVREGSPGLQAVELKRGVGFACTFVHWVGSVGLIHTSTESPRCLLQRPVLVPAASPLPWSTSPNST